MNPKRVALVLAVVATLCFLAGAITNNDWYQVALSDNMWAPSFASVFWDFDGPFDDNTYYAGVFNAISFLLLSVVAVLFWGSHKGK